jgi:hypothetical protein
MNMMTVYIALHPKSAQNVMWNISVLEITNTTTERNFIPFETQSIDGDDEPDNILKHSYPYTDKLISRLSEYDEAWTVAFGRICP